MKQGLEIRLRPVTNMEFQLYRDFVKPAVDWADRNLSNEEQEADPAYAPAELREIVHLAHEKLDHVGFVMTPVGLMMRDEPDILDGNTELAAFALKEYQALLTRL